MRLRVRFGAVLTTVLLSVLVIGVFVLALVVWSRERMATVHEPSTPRRARVSSGVAGAPIRGLPTLAHKPVPVAAGYKECPAEGDGGDPELNRLKNRTDSANWLPAELDAIRNLTWPRRIERRRRVDWTRTDRNTVAKYEGLPLAIEGYFSGVRQSGPEATNCHGADSDFRDWHIWLSPEPGPDRTRAVVVETTPAVRELHPGWKLSVIRKLARDSTKVRVSGWLFLDPEHPDQIGKTRGTIWEIHPVMRIEAWKNARWEVID